MKTKLMGLLLLAALLSGCYVVPVPPCQTPQEAEAAGVPYRPCPPAAFYIYPWPGY